MKNDSAPGTAGLTASFYKCVWLQIKKMVIDFEKGSMSISQRRAIINLIHKGENLVSYELGDWRPISLRNTNYKILAKSLAIRMQGVVKHIIDDDQVGYIKGRNNSTTIRLIDDVMECISIRNGTGARVALDFSKAPDTVNKEFLIENFNIFGFGPQFV